MILVLTIGEVFRYILKKGPITADKLHGALSGYIMIAFLWTFIYALIESFTPGSFTLENVYSANDPHAFFRLLYFSFTTLTTVGYGDITPVTDQARSFVMIEQFSGVFFVGILIARLADLSTAEDMNCQPRPTKVLRQASWPPIRRGHQPVAASNYAR